MQNEPPLVQVNFTDEFKQRLRTLSKKYCHIKSDIQPIIEQLQTGNYLGDQISGTGYTVFKVRVRNSDIQKGKSGGLLKKNVLKIITSNNYFLLPKVTIQPYQQDSKNPLASQSFPFHQIQKN